MVLNRPPQLDFSNSGHIKLALLSQGIHISSKRIFNTQSFAVNQFPYGYSSIIAKKIARIPGELILPDNVYCGLQFRSGSPWTLTMKDNHPSLLYGKTKICDVSFISEPKFYDMPLSNGMPCKNSAILYGNKHILSFFTRGWCYFFSIGKQCAFCSLNPTRQTLGKGNVLITTPKLASESATLALVSNPDIKYINYCAGTHANNDVGLQLQIDIMKAVKHVTPSHVRHHILTMPPNTLSLLTDLKHAGCDTINFALEVFDAKLFKTVCPGKEHYYGQDKFFEAFKYAVNVFGRGNVYCNFVGGLEPITSMKKAFVFLSSIGIVPSINVFHPDPESGLSHRKPPIVSYLLSMCREQANTYKTNSFRPIFPDGGTRNSLDAEVYRGFFDV